MSTDDDKCFGCDEDRCNYTDMLGFPWHWHCFTDFKEWTSNG